jgi:hypothetical protein
MHSISLKNQFWHEKCLTVVKCLFIISLRDLYMTEINIYRLTSNNGNSLDKKLSSKTGQETELGFNDFLEMVNPLQHLPVISHIYRSESGNDIPAVAKIIGGGLFGGVVGAAASAAVSLVEAITDEPLLDSVTEIAQLSTENPSSANVNLTPDSGEAAYNLVSDTNILQKVVENNNASAQPTSSNLANNFELINLRKSPVGLPEFSIEQQINNQLHDKTVDLI